MTTLKWLLIVGVIAGLWYLLSKSQTAPAGSLQNSLFQDQSHLWDNMGRE